MASSSSSLACAMAAAGMSWARGASTHCASCSTAPGPCAALAFAMLEAFSVLAQHRGGVAAGEIAEHGVAGLAGARRIIVEEQADHIAGRVEALDRLVAGVDDARLGVDLHAAEAEGHAAGHRIGAE